MFVHWLLCVDVSARASLAPVMRASARSLTNMDKVCVFCALSGGSRWLVMSTQYGSMALVDKVSELQ